MLYCEECAIRHSLPVSESKETGSCELCGLYDSTLTNSSIVILPERKKTAKTTKYFRKVISFFRTPAEAGIKRDVETEIVTYYYAQPNKDGIITYYSPDKNVIGMSESTTMVEEIYYSLYTTEAIIEEACSREEYILQVTITLNNLGIHKLMFK